VTGTSVGKKGSELDALGKLAPLDIHEQALIALLKGIRDIASR